VVIDLRFEIALLEKESTKVAAHYSAFFYVP